MPAPPNVVAHKMHFHRDFPWKEPVRVATTVAGTLASSFANGQSVDGVTLATGDRILVKNQAAGAENGIYTVNASGAPTRAYDMDVATEVLGTFVFVVAGTANAGTFWHCTNTATPTLGTTVLTFAQEASEMVPYSILAGDTYTVPVYKQALFTMIIDVAGTLDVAGYLIDVA